MFSSLLMQRSMSEDANTMAGAAHVLFVYLTGGCFWCAEGDAAETWHLRAAAVGFSRCNTKTLHLTSESKAQTQRKNGALILSHSHFPPLAKATLLCLCSLKRQRKPDLSHPMTGRKVEGSPKLRALGGTHSRLWRVGAEMGEIVLTGEPG